MLGPKDRFFVTTAPVAPETFFRSPRVRELWRWWSAERDQAGGVPPWSRFDIAQHVALAPYLFLARRVEDLFEYRLHGEAAVHILGHNANHKRLRAGETHDFGRDLHAYYSQVLASGSGWRCEGGIEARRPLTLFLLPLDRSKVGVSDSLVRFESLDLPMARNGVADTILGIIDVLPD